jgi:replicative DNA helicase
MKRQRFDINEYEENRAPLSRLCERTLVAGYIAHKEVYDQVKEFNLRPYFWEDPLARELFDQVNSFIEYRGYHVLKAAIRGSEDGKLVDAFLYLCSFYDEDVYRDDILCNGVDAFHNLILWRLQERIKVTCGELREKIERKLLNAEDISKEVEELQGMTVKASRSDYLTTQAIYDLMVQGSLERACITGIGPLDAMVEIHTGGCTVVIGGESSSGKTSLVNQIAYSYLTTTMNSILYYSTETTQGRLGNRIASYIQFKEKCNWGDAQRRILDWGDRLTISSRVREIRQMTKDVREQHAKQNGIQMVIVDYLQNTMLSEAKNEVERIEKSIMALHELCQDLKIVVIVLCQLTKAPSESGFRRDQKRPKPTLSSFRGAAQIGNSADIAIINQFVDPEPPKNRDAARDVDLHVVKNKEGSQCVVECSFFGKHYAFIERPEGY